MHGGKIGVLLNGSIQKHTQKWKFCLILSKAKLKGLFTQQLGIFMALSLGTSLNLMSRSESSHNLSRYIVCEGGGDTGWWVGTIWLHKLTNSQIGRMLSR